MNGNDYKVGDSVKFKVCRDNHDQQTKLPIYDLLEGTIKKIHKGGIFGTSTECYDILVTNTRHKAVVFNPETKAKQLVEVKGDCLYKHICNNLIIE